MRRSLTKQERLKKKADISRVFASSNQVSCFGAKLFYRENGLSENRVLVTLVRKYGNAVQRNRARRVMKEAFRSMKENLSVGYDLVVLLYPGGDGFESRRKQLYKLCVKAALLGTSNRDGSEQK